jgi:hypothetical protein
MILVPPGARADVTKAIATYGHSKLAAPLGFLDWAKQNLRLDSRRYRARFTDHRSLNTDY